MVGWLAGAWEKPELNSIARPYRRPSAEALGALSLIVLQFRERRCFACLLACVIFCFFVVFPRDQFLMGL